MTRTVRINPDRLWASLMELEQIGAYDDQATGLRGVRRLALTDADAEARRHCVDWMLQAGLLGSAVTAGRIPHAYIECHIKQGPILADASAGIVEGVQSISWQQLTIRGKAAHVGTTPIASRPDVGLVAASVWSRRDEFATAVTSGSCAPPSGTSTSAAGRPTSPPNQATLTIDLRNPPTT
jgi:N-carbamoyl-L-amino-acid hydrolase